MKRNSCAMIIFLYFMDDVSMDSMARGHYRYRVWVTCNRSHSVVVFFKTTLLYSESICHNRAYVL